MQSDVYVYVTANLWYVSILPTKHILVPTFKRDEQN